MLNDVEVSQSTKTSAISKRMKYALDLPRHIFPVLLHIRRLRQAEVETTV